MEVILSWEVVAFGARSDAQESYALQVAIRGTAFYREYLRIAGKHQPL